MNRRGFLGVLAAAMGGVPLLAKLKPLAEWRDSFGVFGGTKHYTFQVIDGDLPPGLFIDTTTGVISGIPTATGNFRIKLGIQAEMAEHAAHGIPYPPGFRKDLEALRA